MRFKSLVTLTLTICLAVLTSNAMAKGKKSEKSDKSAKHSEKSEKSNKRSAKSEKNGNGYGHCKSDKSGKGHSKNVARVMTETVMTRLHLRHQSSLALQMLRSSLS
jgi:hypothetical protein